jgi:hypothetical protein
MTSALRRVMAEMPFYLFGFRRLRAAPRRVPPALNFACPAHRRD